MIDKQHKDGRYFAYYIGRYNFHNNVIRSSFISKDSGSFSYEDTCERIGYYKFFMSDVTKSNFYSLVTNREEFESVLKNNPSRYFNIYEYIEGKKISFILKQVSGVIDDKYINEVEEKLKRVVIKALHDQILNIIKKTARFLCDCQFIDICEFKIKFIISTDFKIYVYKIYLK